MTRTVISQTDLEAKASEIVERVRHGEMAVVESSRIHHDAQVLRRYLNTDINLGKAAEELGLSHLELQDRFLRLGVPLRIGPASMEEALREIAALEKRS